MNTENKNMFEQTPPVGEDCEVCGEEIQQAGNSLYCENGCFEEDVRNYYSDNYR